MNLQQEEDAATDARLPSHVSMETTKVLMLRVYFRNYHEGGKAEHRESLGGN